MTELEDDSNSPCNIIPKILFFKIARMQPYHAKKSTNMIFGFERNYFFLIFLTITSERIVQETRN